MSATSHGSRRPRRLLARAVAFRLGAVLLGLLPLLMLEGVLACLGLGGPDYSRDPFVGFSSVQPLFRPSADGQRWETAPSRLEFFRPDSFARRKGAREYRIFCLGGSTVQGRPFGIETSFATWLELSLRAADPSRDWRVVNCGGISYAIYRLVPILEEVLSNYQPDMVIVYTGHNEFLEDRTYRQIKRVPAPLATAGGWLAQTRTYNVLSHGYRWLSGGPSAPGQNVPVLGGEVDVILNYRGGLEQYHRDEKWRADVIDHFRFNLHRMVHLARAAGVPLLLVNPVSNLRDCAPLKSQHADGLSDDDLLRWQQLVEQAVQASATDCRQAIALLSEAARIDDQYAGLDYLLGGCYDRLEQYDEARRHYLLAEENDVCPLRMLEPMHEALRDVARQSGTPLVDVREHFRQRSVGEIVDGQHLLDHVHPSVHGHQLIAEWLTDELVRQGVVAASPGWEKARHEAFADHLASLKPIYFEKGMQRLEAVQRWAAGMATGTHAGKSGESSGPAEPLRADQNRPESPAPAATPAGAGPK